VQGFKIHLTEKHFCGIQAVLVNEVGSGNRLYLSAGVSLANLTALLTASIIFGSLKTLIEANPRLLFLKTLIPTPSRV
jgi:hypothetical protein